MPFEGASKRCISESSDNRERAPEQDILSIHEMQILCQCFLLVLKDGTAVDKANSNKE